MQWIYSLFLDLMTYCSEALLGIMSTDLQFFEDSVPIVPTLYGVFVAIGWGLLIGNCAFQSMKAMFAGFGLETESPTILLLRTFLFGFLLIFADSVCEIGLSIGKRVIDLLKIPASISLTMPEESMFSGVGSSWVLVIIIGFILGFQLIKLFFEIAERYVLVGVLTMLCPVGLAFGGSKSTKDICTGFIRTYASMIVMMVMNVLFLKLILSALATMPTGALILPWCLLVVGIARTARKADQLVSRIGLSPAMTGDPLGGGRGLVATAMVARTVMSIVGKAGGGRVSGGAKGGAHGNTGGTGKSGNSAHHSSRTFGSSNGTNIHNSKNGTNVGGNHIGGSNSAAGNSYGSSADTSNSSQRNSANSNLGGSNTVSHNQSGSAVRFGSNTYAGNGKSVNAYSGRTQFSSTGKAQVNTNRFGNQPGTNQPVGTGSTSGNGTMNGPDSGRSRTNAPTNPISMPSQTPQKAQAGQVRQSAKSVQLTGSGAKTVGNTGGTYGKEGAKAGTGRKSTIATPKKSQQKSVQNTANKTRFGSGQSAGGVRPNAGPVNTASKPGIFNVGTVRPFPGSTKNSSKPDVPIAADTAMTGNLDAGQTAAATEDGDANG